MAGIFISYRRADSDGWAGRLRDTLRARFGDRVFHDVDNIPDGEIFSEVIDRALQECDVALVIIGPNWATARDQHGRRLDHEEDWVRTETAMVLKRNIRVIPVLVGGATLPRADELPEELRSLTKRQAREIRSNSWDSDVGHLIKQLKQILDQRRKRPVWLYALPVLVILVGIAVVAGTRFFASPPLDTAPAQHAAAPFPEVKPPPAQQIPATPAETKPLPAPQVPATPSEAKPPPALQTPAPRTEAKPAPALPKEAPSAQTSTALQTGKTPPSGKSTISRPSTAEADQPRIAKKPPSPPAAVTAAPVEPIKPAPAQTDAIPVPDRTPLAAPVAPKPAPERIARAAPLNLPNRPASARELRIGDSWTYRLRELRFNKNLATVTHEISGGDASGIRETVRVGPEADSARAATQRRLPLEARIFEQQLDRDAMLFEFAPFMPEFSELQPGVTWTKIAGATSADSVNDWRFRGKVTGRERVTVPAGNFDAIKAELEGNLDISVPTTRNVAAETNAAYQTYAIWFVPEVGRAVKYVRRTYNRARVLLEHEQYELLSYQLK